MVRRYAVLLVAGLGLVACAPRGSVPAHRAATRDFDVLTREEIRASHHGDALMMVEALRPRWLRTRGASSIYMEHEGRIRVYVDDVPVGGPEMLRSIPAETVTRMEFLDGRSATMRFGTNHPNGAILIRTGGG